MAKACSECGGLMRLCCDAVRPGPDETVKAREGGSQVNTGVSVWKCTALLEIEH